jgi:hypothetical protein
VWAALAEASARALCTRATCRSSCTPARAAHRTATCLSSIDSYRRHCRQNLIRQCLKAVRQLDRRITRLPKLFAIGHGARLQEQQRQPDLCKRHHSYHAVEFRYIRRVTMQHAVAEGIRKDVDVGNRLAYLIERDVANRMRC